MILEAAMVRQARLLLAGTKPQKAQIKSHSKNRPILMPSSLDVLFNPEKITYTRDVIYEHTPMPDEVTGGRMNYVGGSGAKLTMELFFDTTDTGSDVREYTDFLIFHTIRDKDSGQPPLVEFVWGDFTKKYQKFKAVIADMDVDFTWFLADGKPVRAETRLILKEPDEALAGQNPTSRGEARKIWVVVEGQTLDWIAFQEYGDSAAWRHIAAINNLTNPMRLRPGQVLKLTPLA
jgi:hypothetical protein